jgi:cell division protein FtsL
MELMRFALISALSVERLRYEKRYIDNLISSTRSLIWERKKKEIEVDDLLVW